MSFEPGSYDQLRAIQQDYLKRKYRGCLVDGRVPLHEYYQEIGDLGKRVPIVEPGDYRHRDRSALEADATSKRMCLQLIERAGFDEIALVPIMMLRAPSLQTDVVASIMSQAEEALRRK